MMEPLYIFRLPSGGHPELSGCFSENNQHRLKYMAKHPDYKTLYIHIGNGNPKHIKHFEVAENRNYSPMFNVVVVPMRRLLTVRSNWSRK